MQASTASKLWVIFEMHEAAFLLHCILVFAIYILTMLGRHVALFNLQFILQTVANQAQGETKQILILFAMKLQWNCNCNCNSIAIAIPFAMEWRSFCFFLNSRRKPASILYFRICPILSSIKH